ncbi:MAG: metallophosphoesterase [Pseudomonadota bacterium]
MKWLTRLRRSRVSVATLRPKRRVYALGDVHGCVELMDQALKLVTDDLAAREAPATLVTLGDYVDRGPASAAVLTRLRELSSFGCPVVSLLGNHERMMCDFLADPAEHGPMWLRNGGMATLASYDVTVSSDMAGMAEALRRALPDGTLAWLEAQPLLWRSGNLVCVHAGFDPAISIASQKTRTMLWGHPAFLRERRRDGAWVIHGHTIVSEPSIKDGRIAVDTGAYASGRLTVGVIEPQRVSFLTAEGAMR